MSNPFEPREKAAADARELAEAKEFMHIQNLLDSASGRWLLGRLVGEFEKKVQRRSSGHNSEDSYHRGIQDCAGEYRDLIIKHFGHAGIDKLMKGKS